jgi:hypothetical protein
MDLSGPGGGDLAGADLAGVDSGADLARPRDLAGVDLASNDDLAAPLDLSMPLDFSAPLDLASSDLSATPDLSMPLDFSTPPDLATMCHPPDGGTCATAPQCGCPTNQTCDVTFDTGGNYSGTACYATGSVPNYNQCNTSNPQCAAGSGCENGVCQPYCSGNPDCIANGPSSLCFNYLDSSGNPIPGDKVCSRTCDPVNPQSSTSPFNACGTNANCLPLGNDTSDCLGYTAAAGTQGASCQFGFNSDITMCAPGFDCLDPSGGFPPTFACYKFCHTGSNADCTGTAAGKTCTAYSTALGGPFTVGGVALGYCK